MQRKNAERVRELNAQRDAAAVQKSAFAKIVQMVQIDRQKKDAGDITYYYIHGTKIEKIYVSAAVQAHLTASRLALVYVDGKTELVPQFVTDKIAERDTSLVVRAKKTSTNINEDDPYTDYPIPDDFTW